MFLKKFARWYCKSRRGRLAPMPNIKSVKTTLKRFFAGFQRVTGTEISDELRKDIYKAWRSKKVLSLVSFDVKGAYNGVYKERLLQRLRARGIPPALVQWIDAFCSRRTATILVNGYMSEKQDLPQAGLPQGPPQPVSPHREI